MNLLTEQVLNMLPLFLLILIGFVSGKALKITDYSVISKLIIFVFTPIIAFNAIITAPVKASLLVLPFLFFFTTTILALVTKVVLAKFTKWDLALINTLSYSSGSGNVAFYGVPAVLILFGDEYLPIILISMIGYIIYDSSIGYIGIGCTNTLSRLLK
ncbi:MAG: AEC family transporter [Candidatus Dojkabacteria bacterium]|nr:AEC family transporter [Candidatus Dojkabacteria bacterium]MDQ7021209.1 AEC family transporter [Candidatus Dojkabacteria bacterium]